MCYIIHVLLAKSLFTLILVTEVNRKIWVCQTAMIRGPFLPQQEVFYQVLRQSNFHRTPYGSSSNMG